MAIIADMVKIASMCIKDSVKWVQQNNGKCLIQRTAKKNLKKNGSKLLKLFFQNNIIYSKATTLTSGCAHCFGCEVDSSGRHTPVAPADFRECRKFMTSHLRASHLENSQERQGKTGGDGGRREREKVKRQAKKATPACNLTHRPHPSSLLQEFWDSTAG